jgi:hypothetical protein
MLAFATLFWGILLRVRDFSARPETAWRPSKNPETVGAGGLRQSAPPFCEINQAWIRRTRVHFDFRLIDDVRCPQWQAHA